MQNKLNPRYLAILLAASVAAVSVPYRLAGFLRPIWLDEADHNRFILDAAGFFELRHSLYYFFQPILEFALRKYFWFPLFGHEEWGLRLPSLVAGVLAVFFCAYLAWRYFRNEPLYLSLSASLYLGLWACIHESETYYSAEARHYSLVSLLSLLWFWSYFRLGSRLSWICFLGLSALFLNCHFFAPPLVGGALAIETIRGLRARSWRRVGLLCAYSLLLFGFSLWLNYEGFVPMFVTRTVQLDPSLRPGILTTLERALRDWLFFFLYGGGVFLFWCAIWLALELRWAPSVGLPGSRETRRKWLFFLACILPLFLLKVRQTSSYPFATRYYTPFFGLVFFGILLGIEHGLHWLGPRRRFLTWALLLVSAIRMLTHQMGELPNLNGQNFTPQFRFFESLKTGEPLLAIANPCWEVAVPKLYWSHIGYPPRGPAFFPREMPYNDCHFVSLAKGTPQHEELRSFFRKYGGGTVLFYDVEGKCPELKDKSLLIGPDAGKCIVARRNVKSMEEALELAREIGFPRPPSR